MKSALRLGGYTLTAIIACTARVSVADDYHYVNMLIGDRASGMGGAYTAISDDATGLFYNPAGVVYTRGRNLSASVNAYHVTQLSYANVLGGGDWTRESSSLLPNFFGVVQPLGNGVAGFSYAVTDSIQENLDQRFRLPAIDQFIINLNNSDSTYKFGPSYAMELDHNLSIGVTLYGHFRSTETVVSQILTGVAGTDAYESQSRYMQSSEFGIEPILGIMWTPMEKLAFGATLRQVTLLDSELRDQQTCQTSIAETGAADQTSHDVCHQDNTGAPHTTPNTEIAEYSFERVYPLQLNLGMAYFPSERLLLSGDFTYYAAADGVLSESSSHAFRSKRATWNLSAGAEYYLSNTWALRGGLFTNNANTPTVGSGVNQAEHVDLLGISASVSRFTRNSSLTAGFSHSTGSGDAQIVSGFPEKQDLSISTTTFFLSTSYNY